MRLLPRVEDCGPYGRRLHERRSSDRNKAGRRTAMLAVAAIVCGILSGFHGPARAIDVEGSEDSIAALGKYVQRITNSQPQSIPAEETGPAAGDAGRGALGENTYSLLVSAPTDDLTGRNDPIAGLHDYIQRVSNAQADRAPASIARGDGDVILPPFTQGVEAKTADRQKFADADSLFDALKGYLEKPDSPAPSDRPSPPPSPAHQSYVPAILATEVGSKVCLGCHAAQAEGFSHTLMGRLHTQGKLECESCHGPASAHVRSVGCAACHGDGGISRRPGMPSLAGLEPQYLVSAMKAYITGQRKHALMKALLSGLGEGELNKIALYYARQIPGRAQTPPVGEASAGQTDIDACAGCHGERGISVSSSVPNLAGQDARYLADQLRAFKYGAREKVVACAPCHGDHGISKTPGMPSLVGLDAQYLVSAMKQYVTGQRKNAVMKALLSGVGDEELNRIAHYYARQVPARAKTRAAGDPSAGKTASAACAGCHATEGVSANAAWPSLAGQDAQYLASALKGYKDGLRHDAVMTGLAASLDGRAINDIASYYASLAPSKPSATKDYAPGGHDPVLVRNGLVASLNERAINDIASYYASLQPDEPRSAGGAPGDHMPNLVRVSAPANGQSIGGIISFRKDDPGRTVEENNGICLNCHERGERVHWKGSVHETRSVACTSCHTIMKSVSAKYQLKTAFEPDTCFQCHKDRRAQMFRSSHMPMREGKIVCSDCHSPHGSTTEKLIRENSVNDNCYKCHAEKRGPFLFEHAPVRENCLNCHDPHGSINEFSLKMSRPRLCYECHTIGHGEKNGPRKSQFTMGRSCQNCHTQIHGSNSPAGAAFQR